MISSRPSYFQSGATLGAIDCSEPPASDPVRFELAEGIDTGAVFDLAAGLISDPGTMYQMLVEHIPAVVYLSPPDDPGDVRYVSPQIETLLGYSQEQWLAKRYFWKERVHPDDRDWVLKSDADSAISGETYNIRYRLLHHDGHEVWLRDQGSLVRDPDGAARFWLGFTFDVTRQKQVEDALVEAENRYRTLVEQIPVVTFIEPHDGHGAPTYISPQIQDLLGYSQEQWREQPDTGIRAIHPEDFADWKAALERTDRTGEPFGLDHRMIRADGRMIWVRSTARLVYDEEGQPQFWQGTMQDITESVLADRRLAESEQRYRSLFDHNPDPVYSFDLDGKLVSANRALSAMNGYSIEEMIGMSFTELVAPSDLPQVTRHFQEAATGSPQDYECRLLRKDGALVDIHVTNLPIVVGGEIVGVYGVAKDISERKDLERQLKHMAFHDGLTGLPNRLLFTERLDQALAALPRGGVSVALLFVDLDSFKLVNDTFGHDIGDQALATAATLISSCVRGSDTVGRIGGDEFTVLLPEVERPEDVRDVAERILGLLGQPIVVDRHVIQFSASIGVVLSSSGDDTSRELLRRGDEAMYQAKAAGKARYTVLEASENSYPR